MKAHEETWEAKGGWWFDGHPRTRLCNIVDDLGPRWDPIEDDPPRLRLAAQAPAMARLLLELQDASNEVDERLCCGADAGRDHAPDCRLISVLRDAGVVE